MSKRRRVLLWAGVLTLLTVTISIPALLHAPKQRHSEAIGPINYERIQIGMDEAAVTKIIGAPPGTYRTREPIGGITSAGNHGIGVAEEGIPESDWPERWISGQGRTENVASAKQWWGTYHAIRVAFDGSGKVAGKNLIEIHWGDEERWSPIDRLRRWLGL